MKTILLSLILFSSFVFGQLKFVENSNDWIKIGRGIPTVELYRKDSLAKITYVDYNTVLNRNNIFSPTDSYEFVFTISDADLEDLYQMISKKYSEKKSEIVTLEFPEGKMYLNFYRDIVGSFGFNFQFDNQSGILDKNSLTKRNTFAFNQKQINKLFGKSTNKK